MENKSCIHYTSSQFYIDEEEGSICLGVCKLKAVDDNKLIYV